MLAGLRCILEKDLRGEWTPDLRGCANCPDNLSCQVTGKPGPEIEEAGTKFGDIWPMLESRMGKALGIPKSFLQGGWVTATDTMTYTAPETVGINSPYVTGCLRPLGIARRAAVSIRYRHDYLWYSPCVPLGVKLLVARELADKILEQSKTPEGRAWRVTDPQDKMVITQDMTCMIRESQQAFAEGGIDNVPTRVRERDDRVSEIINHSGIEFTAQGCLATLWRAFRTDLSELREREYTTAYKNLTKRLAEVSCATSGVQPRPWGISLESIYGLWGTPEAKNRALVQQRIDRMVELIERGMNDNVKSAKEVSQI